MSGVKIKKTENYYSQVNSRMLIIAKLGGDKEMGDQQVINLAVDKVKMLHEASDAQLAIAEVWVCRSGMNSHKLPIDEQAIKDAEYTLINKFLVAGYDEKEEDFKGHEGLKQRIVGFFPKENNIRFEETDDGTYLVANAIISKIYCPWAYDAFLNNNFREVSMEILVAETEDRDDGYKWITSFIINGVTILGLNRRASIKGSHVVVTEFEELIKQGEQFYQQFSINSSLVDSENVKEKNQDKEENTLMDFNKEEFAKVVGMTANQMYEKLNNACGSEKYQSENDDYEYTKYWMRDYSDEYIFAYNTEKDTMEALPFEIEDGEIEIKFGEAKMCRMAYVVEDGEMESVGFNSIIEEMVKHKEEVFTSEKESLTKNIEEVNTKFSTIEEEKSELTKELDELKTNFEEVNKDNEALKEFKANVEATERSNKIEFAIQEVMEDLTAEQIDEWRNKVDEFESVDSFANAIQSFAYGLSKGKKKNIEEVNRISLPNTNSVDEKSKSVWDKLKNK